jgi:hypothetical protein
VDGICSPQTKSLTRCKVFVVVDPFFYLVSNKQQDVKKLKKNAGKTKQA